MMSAEKREKMVTLAARIDPSKIWGPDESDVRLEMQQLICSGKADTAAIAQFLLDAERQIMQDPRLRELEAWNQLREDLAHTRTNSNGSLGK